MPSIIRAYEDYHDLQKIIAFSAAATLAAGDCGQLHVGDIPHRFFNGLRHYHVRDVVWMWEDEQGDLWGWAVMYPNSGTFDYMVHPTQRGKVLERELVEWMEQRIAAWMRNTDHPGDLGVDVFDCDTQRAQVLEALGYKNVEKSMAYLVRPLDLALPEFTLPEGYQIRSAAGVDEAEQLAYVHNGAFNSSWTAESYRRVMVSPGYEAERELVVVAPDGRFASFCIYWLDEVNKSGLFEPVGTHGDFRQKGLTRALMAEGLRRMQAAGMETAIVCHLIGNEAAQRLYEGMGFVAQHYIHFYTKPLLSVD